MEDIFSKYLTEEKFVKEKGSSFLSYQYRKSKVYIFEKEISYPLKKISNGELIILFKGIKGSIEDKINNYYWFNFDNKTLKRNKNKEVLRLQEFLREFGIRFLRK